MRIAAAVISILVHVMRTAAADTPVAPTEPEYTSTHALAVDGRLGVGELIGSQLTVRYELGVSPGHALIVRGGVGVLEWIDQELDDPSYNEMLVRFGYRMSSRYLFAGIELGPSWFKPSYPPDVEMRRDSSWFVDAELTVQAGLKLGPVRLGVDRGFRLRQTGVQLGVEVFSM